MIATYIAIIAISVAIAAQMFAVFATRKALREIDKVSSSRASRRAEEAEVDALSLAASQRSATNLSKYVGVSPKSPATNPERTADSPIDSHLSITF